MTLCLMNKLFLTSTQFQNNRLDTQIPSPRQYFSWGLLILVLLAAAVSYLAPRTLWLQAENNGLEQRTAALQDTVTKISKERKNLKDAIENYRKESGSIQFQLQKIQGRLDSITEEKTYLEEILVNKTKEMESLKKHGLPARSMANTTGNLAATRPSSDEEIRKLNEQNTLLSQKLERLYKTTNSKMTEINVAKIALEDTITEARKTIDNEWNTVNLGSIRVSQGRPTAGAPSEQKSQPVVRPTSSKKQGKVLAINEEHGFVVVDLGKVDGIKSDSVLTLKRNNDVIATLTVLEIRDVMTACNIKDLNPGKKIAVNDLASILK